MNKDTIYRQDAIDLLKKWSDGYCYIEAETELAVKEFQHLPSAQPERLTDDDFETIRIHLSACREKLCNQNRLEEAEEYQRIIDRFMAFASAQPEVRSEEQTIKGYSIDQLILIANVLKRENLPPERVAEALTDMQRVIAMVQIEFEESLRQSVKWFMEDDLK